MAELTRPFIFADASGEWISAREAILVVQNICDTTRNEAIKALCRRAVEIVPVNVLVCGRWEEPHEYVDRADYIRERNCTFTHFKRTLVRQDYQEMRLFFDSLKEMDETGFGGKFEYANWEIGDFKAELALDFSDVTLEFVGLKFDRIALVHAFGSDALPTTGEQNVPVNRIGGRPPAAWWDDLWVEIFRQIWNGDLKPKAQADIERAMLTWIETNKRQAAESTVRGRARKLWETLQLEDEN